MSKNWSWCPKSLDADEVYLDLPGEVQRDIVLLYHRLHPFGAFKVTEGAYLRRTAADRGEVPRGAADWRQRLDLIVGAGFGFTYLDASGVEHFGLTAYDEDAPGRLVERRGDAPVPLPAADRGGPRRTAALDVRPKTERPKTERPKTERPKTERKKKSEDARSPEVSDEQPTPVDIGESWDGYSDIGPDPAGEPADPFDGIRPDVDAWLHAVAVEKTAANRDRMGLDHTQPGPMRALTRDLYPMLVGLIEGTKPRAKTFPIDQIAAGLRRHIENAFNMGEPSHATLINSLIAQIRHARESAHRERRLIDAVRIRDPLEELLERVKAGSPYPETGKERAAFENYCEEREIGHWDRQVMLEDSEAMTPIMVEIREKVQTVKMLMAQLAANP